MSVYFVPFCVFCRVWLSTSVALCFSLVAYRNPPWPATSHLCGQAARGWTHFGRLQHPERLVFLEKFWGFNILIVVGLSNGGLQCWHTLRKEVEHNFVVPIDSKDEEMLLLPVSSYSDMELRLMQSQPCTWYCACGEESLSHHWWLWQGNTTRRRWFVASSLVSIHTVCLCTLVNSIFCSHSI